MIIEMILSALFNVFKLLTSIINIPSLPDTIHTYLDTAMQYIEMGIGIIANYTHLGYLLVLFGIIVAIDVGISIYHFVMWILRKIPVINIS